MTDKSAIEKMVEYLHRVCEGTAVVSIGEITDMARRLLSEEQAQKPVEPPCYVSDDVLKAYLAQGITHIHGHPLVPYQKPPTDMAGLVEELADLEHRRWAHWQTHFHKVLRENCPSEALEKALARWDKQIATQYKDLSEREKEMDRIEARKSLEILSRYARPTSGQEGKATSSEDGLREFVVRLVERAKYLGHSRVDLPVRILEKSLEMYPSHPSTDKCEKEPRHE